MDTAQPLYDFAPLARMMLLGVVIALGPLAWVWLRNRQAPAAQRLRVLTLLTLFLTFDLVLFGAFTRLTDSGLGCPDWPGCYGSASPLGAHADISAAQQAMPTGPVTHSKAWVEMIHRYLATAVGVLILVLASVSWVERKRLKRRFQKIIVGEPTVEATIAILRGLQEKYEVHHGVQITDPAIVAAAELSHRYITDRFLPDKAIDLIDEAASKIKIELDSKPEVMDKLDRRLIQLQIEREAVRREKDEASQKRFALIEEEIVRLQKEISDLDEIWQSEKAQALGSKDVLEEIDRINVQIEGFTRKGDFNKVAELQYGKLPELKKRLQQAQDSEDQKGAGSAPKLLRTQVGAEEIAEVVARATGIPVAKLMQGERDKLLVMEAKLHQRVVGQDEAITAVANAIRRSRSGLSDPNRPTGSFLFLGPTGVGKTELCKALAGFLFDSEDHLIRVDMSEFMEKHSVARLIGAPPGYVGYEEGGHLTEAVRRKPYSVLLLDEVEKAHPDVFNVLLQVLDDGRLTDGQGRTVDFKNTVIVMTSNIGSPIIQSMVGRDSADIKEAVWDELKNYFRPEFLNRIDETVVFHALDAQHIEAIAGIQLKVLQARLAKLDLQLDVSPAALAELAKVGFDPVFGARPLKRAIQQRIENPLSKLLLEGKFPPKSVIPVDVDPIRAPGEFSFGAVPAPV